MTNTASSEVDWDTFERREQERARLAAEARLLNKAALFDALDAAGIGTVEVRFDGCGDSGQIEELRAQSNGAEVALPEGTIEFAEPRGDRTGMERSAMPIDEAIEALAYSCLEEIHDGWENNDGAYGDFIFDATARIITLAFNARYTESERSEHSF